MLRHLPRKRQTLFFTATINKKIKSLAYDVVRDAIRIHVSPKNPVSKNVNHAVASVEMDDKRYFLENLLKEFDEGKFIVFSRTKVRVERVVAAMKRVDVESEALHGGIEQADRFAILDRFRKGDNRILVTTDVACRGIDIPDMDYVINYDIPDNPENYVHRCGRTGRGNNKGHAISFCAENEEELIELQFKSIQVKKLNDLNWLQMNIKTLLRSLILMKKIGENCFLIVKTLRVGTNHFFYSKGVKLMFLRSTSILDNSCSVTLVPSFKLYFNVRP